MIILKKIADAIAKGKGVVLDCGLVQDKHDRAVALAERLAVPLYKYALIAPRDILLSRVRERDVSKGKATDEERFEYTYGVQQAKDFEGYEVFDTSKISPEEIGNIIVKNILKN